jgi:four helix bundle protein
MKENILAKKTIDFAVKIIKFYKFLCNEKREYVISKQILKSGTSIGANVRESRNAQSEADFINKLNIALKEADETQYWLEIMEKSDIINIEQFEKLNKDVKEIISILVSTLKTLKKKMARSEE